MGRTNAQTEVYKDLQALEMYALATGASPGDSTVALPIAKGASTITVASATNFVANDPIFIIGSGGLERNEITSLASNVLTLKYKTEIPQDAGAQVKEAVKIPLGYPSEQGLQFSGSLQNTPIMSAISKLPVGYIPGVAEISLNFGLLGWNIENLQLMFGQDESVQGTGTAADPHQGSVIGATVGKAGTRVLVARGTRADAKTWSTDFNDLKHEISGNVQMGAQTANYPVAGKCSSIVKRIWT